MTSVEFRNLIGRVGRIKFNLCGNVFFISDGKQVTEKEYVRLLKEPIPDRKLLKVLNQTGISDFACLDTTHISTLWLDNVSGAISVGAILLGMNTGSRVRLFNFSWSMSEAHDVSDFMALLDTMRGLDQNGNNTPQAQVYGTIHVPSASAWFLANVASRYNDLTITYDEMLLTVLYRDYDESLLDYELVESGVDAVGGLTLFFDPEEKIYQDVDLDSGCMMDTGNIDARTEGMSYGMMMCVQMDRKDLFDRLWQFTMRYMYHAEGKYPAV